jgi:hypothetical protein
MINKIPAIRTFHLTQVRTKVVKEEVLLLKIQVSTVKEVLILNYYNSNKQ